MILTIIIPVFNEKPMIPILIEEVFRAETPGFEKEVIFVDDGSTDGSGQLLEKLSEVFPIVLLRHERNIGKAASIKTALERAKGDIILIQDADLEYHPSDYKIMLSEFRERDVSAVYGSRFLKRRWPERMRLPNWVANKVFTIIINLLYGSRLTDEGTAYKAFRREVIKDLEIESCGFEFCPEVTVKLLKRGINIKDVPVSYRARGRKEGKKPRLIDGIKILWTILKYRFKD